MSGLPRSRQIRGGLSLLPHIQNGIPGPKRQARKMALNCGKSFGELELQIFFVCVTGLLTSLQNAEHVGEVVRPDAEGAILAKDSGLGLQFGMGGDGSAIHEQRPGA